MPDHGARRDADPDTGKESPDRANQRKHPSGRHIGFARPAAVLAAAAVLLLAPGIAQAAFTTGATCQMSAATFSLAQPVGTAATSSCTGRDLTITFTNYEDVQLQ